MTAFVRCPLLLSTAALLLVSPACLERKEPPVPKMPDLVQVPLTTPQVREITRLGKEAAARYGAGDFAGCVDAATRQVGLWDRNESSLYNLACCLSRAGRLDEAEATLRRAVETGFFDRSQIAEDEDLEPLRSRASFPAILELADTKRKATEALDPLLGPAVETGPWRATEQVRRGFAPERRRLAALAPAIGPRTFLSIRGRLTRSYITALDALAARLPREAEAASFSALEATESLAPSSPQLIERCDRFLAAFPTSRSLPAATMIRARARLAAAAISEDPARLAAARDEFRRDAKRVVATRSSSVAARDAWYWLLGDALDRGDTKLSADAWRALRRGWRRDRDFWEEHGYELFEPRMRVEGLPSFKVSSIDGQPLSPENFRGRITLLDFWATWCGPCRAEIPFLHEAWKKWHAKGFDIVGVSGDAAEDQSAEAFREFLAKNEMPWPQYRDGLGSENRLFRLFGIAGIPTSVLLDREGNVVAVNLRGEELDRKLAELLGTASPTS